MPPPIDMNRFEQLKATGDLPSPRGVALAIIRLTQAEEVSMAELARVIKSDPAFVGRLIKAANGVVSFHRRAVVSVQEALMVLGLPAVRTMALGFSLLSSYRKGGCVGFDYGRFWSSSLLMALSMQVIAQRLRVIAADEAFSLGLLARVGELALATLYPSDYGRLLLESQRFPELRLSDLEQQSFALTHNELSAAMLADWGLPVVFTEPVLYFEQAERAGFSAGGREEGLLQSLVLSRALTEICLASEVEQAALMPPVLKLATRLGLDRDDFAAACERIGREWLEWSKLLQLESVAPPAFGSLVQKGTAALPRAEPLSPVQPVAAPSVESGMRVMVVDAEPAVRRELRGLLEAAGHLVVEAGNGREGMELALEVQPHMMVLDWAMPEMDGLELVRALRATKMGRGIYVLLLTQVEDDQRLVEAFEAGADDFVVKPVSPRVLGARLRAGQRVVRLQQELERDREEIRHFAAELAITNRRLQEAALTDALTGFPNRRYAIERIQQEWIASTRNRRPLSCMLIDLDGFKQINDSHGHDVGDMVLRQAADALRVALRGQDVICRTGGDEFIVICPDTELDAAMTCGERLREAVEALVVETGGPRLKLTISVGVAVRDASMEDVDALIKRADQGAYKAKQRGRNLVASMQGAGSDESSAGTAGLAV
ncbi:diguanylate cyclase [Azoarcus sp. TTM-91]|uniref:GGDEF domain-containing response regulator n=1 Tax=Azoarcus sp. TTM-91 TaxID=2691581 RepID=UPI00145E10CC|nr:diguanylate cyclase [Azoarcus sp. TTM-91]NMG34773.1 diguanylate cyclase [Azoarcus sp. TTM-91]